MTDWPGRVVWLIGASRGVGRAVAARLARAGARVIVSARSRPALHEFAAAYAGSVALPLDVTRREAVLAAHDELLAGYGRLDLLVWSVRRHHVQGSARLVPEEWLLDQQVNFSGVLHVLDAAMPGLLAQGSGHIALVADGTSGPASRGNPSPSAAALRSLAVRLSEELRGRGIGVSLTHRGIGTPRAAGDEGSPLPEPLRPPAQADRLAVAMLEGWARGVCEMGLQLPLRPLPVLGNLLPEKACVALARWRESRSTMIGP